MPLSLQDEVPRITARCDFFQRRLSLAVMSLTVPKEENATLRPCYIGLNSILSVLSISAPWLCFGIIVLLTYMPLDE